MTIDEFLRHFSDYEVTPKQLEAAHWLEYMGYRFMVDFGFENAEKMLWGTAESMPWELPRSMWSVQ